MFTSLVIVSLLPLLIQGQCYVGLEFLCPSISSRPFSAGGGLQPGTVTTYGPNDKYPPGNEAGYRKNEVGVACSSGIPGGDPEWNKILASGTKMNSLDPETIWPMMPTVAVSQKAWGKSLCWQKLIIRSRITGETITAVVVDACPTNGCLWNSSSLAFNADVYGVDTFLALGGKADGGSVDVDIQWPAGMRPFTSNALKSASVWFAFSLILI
jgi:hypothetical protein